MQNAMLEDSQKDCQEKYQQPQICRWCHANGRKWRRTKEPLDEGGRGEWKSWLETLHSKTKIVASGPIISWQIAGETMETVTDFIFLGSKITVNGDCSHEIKRRLLLGRKAMTNLDSILKSRDNTLPKKVCLVKTMVFPLVMYGCESWTIKKPEYQWIDAFRLWAWRLLRVPWTARRSNQSILKEISLEYSLEGLMLKLKPQYFGYLMWRATLLDKTLMLGKIKGRRRRGWQRTRWLDGSTDSMDMGLSKLREIVKDREAWGAAVHGASKSRTWLSDWTASKGNCVLTRLLCGKESACQCRKRQFHPQVRKIPWRRKWQPAQVFLPGKSQGQGNLAGYSPGVHK